MRLPERSPSRFCSERGRLTDALADASGRYAELVNALVPVAGTIRRTEYQERMAAVERARMDTDKAREALLQHRAEHSC